MVWPYQSGSYTCMAVGTMVKRLFTYPFMAIVALALLSCEHKDMCLMHPHTAPMRVNVDWSDFIEKETPSGMTVIMYPQSGELLEPVFTRSNTISHAIVNLPEGRYNSVVFNQSESEFGTLGFRNLDKYSTAEVVTVEAAAKWYNTKGENERIAHEPEWFGTDNEVNLDVTSDMITQSTDDYHQDLKGVRSTKSGIDFVYHKPQNIIHTIHITVYIENIYNLRSARAALEGVSEGYHLGKGEALESVVTHLVEQWQMTKDPQDPTKGEIKATLLCFGLPKGHTGGALENIFNLSLLLVDNKTVLDYKFEVGDDFEEDDTSHLHLKLAVDLPKPLPDVKPEGEQGGGFDASVTDWGEEIEHKVEL